MSRWSLPPRSRALIAVLLPLVALFVYVALRSGPLAPVAVTLATVREQPVTPSLFGVGTVDSQYTHRIGPTSAARLRRLDVEAGDVVHAGQVLGEMDPVDLDDRVRSQEAAVKRADAGLLEVAARQSHAAAQAVRYERLFARRLVSEEVVDTKREELRIASTLRWSRHARRLRAHGPTAERRSHSGAACVWSRRSVVSSWRAVPIPARPSSRGRPSSRSSIPRACGSMCVSTRSMPRACARGCPHASRCVRAAAGRCRGVCCAWSRRQMP